MDLIEQRLRIICMIDALNQCGHPSRVMPALLFDFRSHLEKLQRDIEVGTATQQDVSSLKSGIMRYLSDDSQFAETPIGRELVNFCLDR